MDNDKLKKQLVHTLEKQLRIPLSEEVIEQPRSDFDMWDSVRHLEIMLAIETDFAVRFSSNELIGLREPAEILANLKEKLSLT
jgi:acyl carrier protein